MARLLPHPLVTAGRSSRRWMAKVAGGGGEELVSEFLAAAEPITPISVEGADRGENDEYRTAPRGGWE